MLAGSITIQYSQVARSSTAPFHLSYLPVKQSFVDHSQFASLILSAHQQLLEVVV